MASLTIRKLDEAVKVYLRLRSAKNGRSVEEEVRVILGDLIQGRPYTPATPPPAVLSAGNAPSRGPRRFGAPGATGRGISSGQDGWRGCGRGVGTTLDEIPQNHPDFLLDGAAVLGRTQPQIDLYRLIELSDGQAGHGRVPA